MTEGNILRVALGKRQVEEAQRHLGQAATGDINITANQNYCIGRPEEESE